MKHYKYRRKLKWRLTHIQKSNLKYYFFVAMLTIFMVGNNSDSLKIENQPNRMNYFREIYSPENDMDIIGTLRKIFLTDQGLPLKPNLGIGNQRQIGLITENDWSNTVRPDRYYIQSAMNLQNGGLRDWEDYLLSGLGSSTGNHQNLSGARLESFLNPTNQDGGGGNPLGHIIGSSLEYPHSSNYGGGYDTGSAGGSLGEMASGGGNSTGLDKPQENIGGVPIPEPSTLILTAIGLLLLAWRKY
jgi:hypothetical protein